MLIIFESILPIFLLVILGVVLKRTSLIHASFWGGLEQFGYFVMFPALLFQTLSTTDFSALESGRIGLVSLLAVGVMTALVLSPGPCSEHAAWAVRPTRRSSRPRRAGMASWRSPSQRS